MVLGTSPAVVTETLFALEEQHDFRLGIHRIDLITTKSGRARSEDVLKQQLRGLGDEHDVKLTEVNWHVVSDEQGHQLDDLITDSDSQAAAELILKVIRQLCLDDMCQVFASLAGGRKTMSYFMGLAMSLCARNEDKLYHVLVPPQFEKFDSGFFYPRKGEESPISLPELPFPRLRGYLEEKKPDLYSSKTSFDKFMKAANQALGPDLPPEFTLLVDLENRKVWIQEVQKPPVELKKRFINLFEVLIKLDRTPRKLDDLLGKDQWAKTTKRNFRNYITPLNDKLEKEFGRRARIASTGGGRGRPAEYSLPRGMQISTASSPTLE